MLASQPREQDTMNERLILLFEGPLTMSYNCKHDQQFSARCQVFYTHCSPVNSLSERC